MNVTKINNLILFLSLIVASPFSFASEQAISEKIGNLEGVYKNRFPNMYVGGEKYTSEDIIEIIPYQENSIYFRLHLEFANGHFCKIYGIAEYSNNSFIYKGKESSMGSKDHPCTLQISTDPKFINITDSINQEISSSCSGYCGARGSLTNYKMEIEKKRKIRYMPIILKSTEYADAIKEYESKGLK